MSSAKSAPFIKGERIALRPLQTSDVGPRYLAWMNDPEVTRFLEARFGHWTLEELAEFVAGRSKAVDDYLFAIVDQNGARHVGNIRLGPISRVHGTASVALMIGERACWGQGYGTEAIRLICKLAFEDLGIRRLTAGIYETNMGSIAAFKKVGFATEGCRRSHWRDGDRYVDGLLFGLLRTEWIEQNP